ncbi:saccharopine dehydrogenase family protein [Kistimonas asteriae]|uniref:saccharopine dehydrogenase family protein n=1 Tax=Kistimonas asteriae TaxID=517724 RepID=UPI001BAE55BE|nr:saccharopine dehydrogenase C-terminal domain-containing protein [Kistimonas asteriae]
MKQILLIGAGKIGAMISELLAGQGGYEITVADSQTNGFDQLPKYPAIRSLQLDVYDHEALSKALKGKYAVISAGPYHLSAIIAEAALKHRCHYLDLTEDVANTRLVKALAENAETAFIPQCGLAPGFISIITHHLASQFDRLDNVHMRVGALPTYPSNGLKYNLTWSTEGLLNEYSQACEAIVEGELKEVQPLDQLEHFSLDGINYEAFNTSGGLGTLCETLHGKVRNLNYRTVRYPGHRDAMKLLLNDLRLKERRDLLKEIMEDALPITLQDVVLVFVTVSGEINNRLVQETWTRKLYGQKIGDRFWSAIQTTTASSICAMLDLLAEGRLPQKGLIRQEDTSFEDFINNRFGQVYLGCEKTLSQSPLPGERLEAFRTQN